MLFFVLLRMSQYKGKIRVLTAIKSFPVSLMGREESEEIAEITLKYI